jgi:hypothetical protein
MSDALEQSDQTEWKLILSSGPDAGQIYPITGDSFTIGREFDNDLSLDALQVSRHHVRLTRQDERIVVEDLQSANGTLINGEPLLAPRFLQSGDIIGLGSFTFKAEGPVQNIPQARIKTQTHPIAPVENSKTGSILLIVGIILTVLAIILVGVLGLGYFVSDQDTQTAVDLPDEATVPPDVPAIVINQAPAENSQIQINQSVTVQAIASDSEGVTRIELWTNERLVDEISSSLAQHAPSMAATFQWTPARPGTYALEIKAYNQSGLSSTSRVTVLTVLGDANPPQPEPTDTPSPTITPLPPSATPTPTPTATSTSTPTPIPPTSTLAPVVLTVNVPLLNVRTGPGTQYNRIEQLRQNNQVEIVGQASNGQDRWWQIRLDSSSAGLGWVSGDPSLVTVLNTGRVPIVAIPPVPVAAPTNTPTSTPTEVIPVATVIYAPSGRTLLIVSNRSSLNHPARLTLSGGRSVGGGREIDIAPNSETEIVLEPDFYRALWSSPARGSFARGADFTAVVGKVVVMWIIPEDGLTMTEVYDQLTIIGETTPTAVSSNSVAEPANIDGPAAPPGKALLLAANRSALNNFALVTLSGGSFGGGREIILDANTETPLELLPGNYRAVWSTPAHGGFNAGRDFTVTAGQVIFSWIIPEDGQVFMQFPGQPVIQINN